MVAGIHSRRRIIALMGIFGLVFLSLVGRMSYLQFVQGEELGTKGFLYRMRKTPIQADRGEILDRNGQPLLTNVVCESIYAQPIVLKNKPAAAQALAPILGMKPEDLETRMNRPSYFEWLKRKVKPAVADQVRALKIQGIGFAPEKCREYPEGELAVHALGIANLDHQGIEGLELWYNSKLKGENGAIQCEYTARGLPMDGGECRVMAGKPGMTLQTTLDMGMQRLAEKNVERAMLETHSQRAAMIVMQVKTGEILALAQQPTYDPLLGGNSDMKLRRIFTVADTLPPGSIFKPVTASAALQSGVINKETPINDPGCMQVNGWSICNWDHKGLGTVTIREVMAKSSNVGFGTLGMWLGRDNFYKYHELFGLNRKTGIDLPGEAVGTWIPKNRASDVDLATQGFGQTLTVSPIQMLTAIGAIANDGRLMWPHLGKAFLDANGRVVERIEPKMVNQAISPEVARYVQELMVGVVETGTGKNARVAGYQVGGKTGTATKVIDGKIAKGKYIASFVGFAPYPNPEVVVLISVDEPQGAYYGGQIAAPIFGEAMAEILAYLKAPVSTAPAPKPANPWDPQPPRPREQAIVPSVVNLPPAEAIRVAKAAGFELFLDGSGAFVTDQFPAAGSTAYKGGQMAGNTDLPEPGSEKVHVPDLTGRTLQEAAQLLAQRGIFMDAAGEGVVVNQEAPPGAEVRKGTPVRVTLQPKPKKP
ncbi:MAG TPA: penicillin-binding transpeptidase domain-containing protein [Symbiobacteriaceae bacterium]|nr:penicillin-binding transpeptidase domain-containing protein [Symbiobacteriaceae bacterium]